MQQSSVHDPASWDFSWVAEHPGLALAAALRNQWPVLYYLMVLGDSILEVGAGSGKTSILAKRLCPAKRVVALDAAAATVWSIQALAAYTGTPIQPVLGDALDLPFCRDSFGITFSVGMLEHYPDEWIIQALREQARVSRWVLASVPLDHYATFRHLHGDERLLSKTQWMALLAQVAPLADVSFMGPATEEFWLQALLDTERVG